MLVFCTIFFSKWLQKTANILKILTSDCKFEVICTKDENQDSWFFACTGKNYDKISGRFCIFPHKNPFLSQNGRFIRPFFPKNGKNTKLSHYFSQCEGYPRTEVETQMSPFRYV